MLSEELIKQLKKDLSIKVDYKDIALGDNTLYEKMDMFCAFLKLTGFDLTENAHERWCGVCKIIDEWNGQGAVSTFDYSDFDSVQMKAVEKQVKEMATILNEQLSRFKQQTGLYVHFEYDYDVREVLFLLDVEQVIQLTPEVSCLIDKSQMLKMGVL